MLNWRDLRERGEIKGAWWEWVEEEEAHGTGAKMSWLRGENGI